MSHWNPPIGFQSRNVLTDARRAHYSHFMQGTHKMLRSARNVGFQSPTEASGNISHPLLWGIIQPIEWGVRSRGEQCLQYWQSSFPWSLNACYFCHTLKDALCFGHKTSNFDRVKETGYKEREKQSPLAVSRVNRFVWISVHVNETGISWRRVIPFPPGKKSGFLFCRIIMRL
jgi:hypothetical protein